MVSRQYTREWVTKDELIQAIVLQRDALTVLEECVSVLEDGGRIAVGFRPSLERGLTGMHTFAGELRTSLGMLRAGSPFRADSDPAADPKSKPAKPKASPAKKKTSRRGR